jgi:hypothetical protein
MLKSPRVASASPEASGKLIAMRVEFLGARFVATAPTALRAQEFPDARDRLFTTDASSRPCPR